jgi:hypothetical protein
MFMMIAFDYFLGYDSGFRLGALLLAALMLLISIVSRSLCPMAWRPSAAIHNIICPSHCSTFHFGSEIIAPISPCHYSRRDEAAIGPALILCQQSHHWRRDFVPPASGQHRSQSSHAYIF